MYPGSALETFRVSTPGLCLRTDGGLGVPIEVWTRQPALNEFYRDAFRQKRCIDELQVDLDLCFGKTPMRTFYGADDEGRR
jgi:hypothetical protein